MKRISVVAFGAAVLMVSSAALAQPNTSSRNGTMVRASERVAINAAKNPDAPGLPRAGRRLAANAVKHQDNGPRDADIERPQGAERVDRPDRPQVALSPSIAERPLPPGLAERPLPRGL